MTVDADPRAVRPAVDLAPIDFGNLKARVDLRELVRESLPGVAWFRDSVCCPFHDDHAPSMKVWADHFHCFACGEHGDVLDFLMKLEGLTRPQAAKRLDPTLTIADDLQDRRPRPRPTPRPTPTPTTPPRAEQGPSWLDPEWQSAVDAIVAEAEAELWTPAGRPALDWLRGRGLGDEVIRRYRLGWNPQRKTTRPIGWLSERDGEPKGIAVARGVVLPWLAPHRPSDPSDRWVGANVRCLADPVDAPLPPRRDGSKAAKTICLNGSTRGFLYPQPEPWPHLRHRPVLLVEGEVDALLGEQLLGDQLPVFSVGGASTRTIAREARVVLARSPLWLIATDHDKAGVEAARFWKRLNPDKVRRVLLPRGKDFADFVSQGGDALAWLDSIKAKPLLMAT